MLRSISEGQYVICHMVTVKVNGNNESSTPFQSGGLEFIYQWLQLRSMVTMVTMNNQLHFQWVQSGGHLNL